MKAEGKERARSGIPRFRGKRATPPSGFGAGRSGLGVVKPPLLCRVTTDVSKPM